MKKESADNIAAISNPKKIKAKSSYDRSKSDHYRIGVTNYGDTFNLVRALHLHETYRYLP